MKITPGMMGGMASGAPGGVVSEGHAAVLETLGPRFELITSWHAGAAAPPARLKNAVAEIAGALAGADDARATALAEFEASTMVTCDLRIQATKGPVTLDADILKARQDERERVRGVLEDLKADVVGITRDTALADRQRIQLLADKDALRTTVTTLQDVRLSTAKVLQRTLVRRTELQLACRQLMADIQALNARAEQLEEEKDAIKVTTKRRARASIIEAAKVEAKLAVVAEKATVVVGSDRNIKLKLKQCQDRLDSLSEAEFRLKDEMISVDAFIADLQAVLGSFDPSAETNLQRKIAGLVNEQDRERARIAEERKQNRAYVVSCDGEAKKIRTEALEAEKLRLSELKRKLQRLLAAKSESQEQAEQSKRVSAGLKSNALTAKTELASMTTEMLEANDACFKIEEKLEVMESEHDVFTATKKDRNKTVDMKNKAAQRLLDDKTALLARRGKELAKFVADARAKEVTFRTATKRLRAEHAVTAAENDVLDLGIQATQAEIDTCVAALQRLATAHAALRAEKTRYLADRDSRIERLQLELPEAITRSHFAEAEFDRFVHETTQAKADRESAASGLRAAQDELQPWEDRLDGVKRTLGNKRRAVVDAEAEHEKARASIKAAKIVMHDEHYETQLDMDTHATRFQLARAMNTKLATEVESLMHRAETMADMVNNLLAARSSVREALEQSEGAAAVPTYVGAEANHGIFLTGLASNDAYTELQTAARSVQVAAMAAVQKRLVGEAARLTGFRDAAIRRMAHASAAGEHA